MPRNDKYKLTEQEIQQKLQKSKGHNEIYFENLDDNDSDNAHAEKEDNHHGVLSDFSDEDSYENDYQDVLNKSGFKAETGYIPYGGGIDFESLDQDPNWQFIDADENVIDADKLWVKVGVVSVGL